MEYFKLKKALDNADILSVCTVMGEIKMPLHITSRTCTSVYHMQRNLLRTVAVRDSVRIEQ